MRSWPVWGAPVANEDDAERSVRAALDIVESVADLGATSGVELLARAGVVTGEVAITIGKVSEGMVIGDTVNAASRVQSVAPPGSVLVDEATWRSSSGAIAFSEFGELNLKGKEEPVRAWRAERVVAQRRGVGRTQRLEPPFVGRDEELRLVKELLHATARERKARLVSVTGIPGIGKSRLCWELLKYVDGLAETVYWHEGRSPAYGEGITFWALGEMVRTRAGINESEDAASSRSKLASSLSRVRLRPRGATLDRAPPRPPARSRGRPVWRARGALLGLADLLRTRLRPRPGRHGLRGPAVGRPRPRRLHRVDPRVVEKPPHHGDHPLAPRAHGPQAQLGGRTSAPSPRFTWSPSPIKPWPSCSTAS